MRLFYVLLVVMWLCWPLHGIAQTIDDLTPYDVEMQVLKFYDELERLYIRSGWEQSVDYDNPMSDELFQSMTERIDVIDEALQLFITRWTTYQQGVQSYISSDDSLLVRASEVLRLQQKVAETLAALHQRFDKLSAFSRAEEYLFSLDEAYATMYNHAAEFSLVAQLAPQLEKLKASEELQFAEVQRHYTDAKLAAAEIPQLAERMDRLENKYVELKVVSEKIQNAVYVPFIQRIKDWLMSFAAVAMLLMFANMVVVRLNSVKKMRAQAKKMKDMLGGAQDYPTI